MDYHPLVAQCLPLADLYHFYVTKVYILHQFYCSRLLVLTRFLSLDVTVCDV